MNGPDPQVLFEAVEDSQPFEQLDMGAGLVQV